MLPNVLQRDSSVHVRARSTLNNSHMHALCRAQDLGEPYWRKQGEGMCLSTPGVTADSAGHGGQITAMEDRLRGEQAVRHVGDALQHCTPETW